MVAPKVLSFIKRKQRKVRFQANFAICYFSVITIGNIAFAFGASGSVFQKAVATVITFVVFAVVFVSSRSYLRKSRDVDRYISNLKPAPEPYATQLYTALGRFSTDLEVSILPTQIRLNPENLGQYPAVAANKQQALILCPAGYLKTMHVRPAVADALLAHEFSHVAGRDSQAVLVTTSVLRAGVKILVPLVAVSYLLLIVGLIVADGQLNALRASDEKLVAAAKEKDKQLEQQASQSNEIVISDLELDEFIKAEAREAPLRYYITDSTIQLVFGTISIFLLVLLVSALRNLRHQTEELADMTAAALCGVEPVLAYLSEIPRPATLQQRFLARFSLHPSPEYRKKNVASFQQSVA